MAFGWVGMTFGLGLWATISAIAVGTAVGIVLLIPLTLLGSRTATNNATSSGAAFGVRGRLIGSGIGLLTCLSVALTVWTSGPPGSRSQAGCSASPTRRSPGGGVRAGGGRVRAVAIWGYRWLVRATAAIFAIGGI